MSKVRFNSKTDVRSFKIVLRNTTDILILLPDVWSSLSRQSLRRHWICPSLQKIFRQGRSDRLNKRRDGDKCRARSRRVGTAREKAAASWFWHRGYPRLTLHCAPWRSNRGFRRLWTGAPISKGPPAARKKYKTKKFPDNVCEQWDCNLPHRMCFACIVHRPSYERAVVLADLDGVSRAPVRFFNRDLTIKRYSCAVT